MKKPAHHDVGVELNIGPIVEGKFVNPIEKFLLFLKQDVLVERGETVAVLLEGFVEHHVLYPPILDDFFFTASEAMFIDFQDVFGIVGLNEETNRDHVSTLKFVKSPFDEGAGERQSFDHLVRGFRPLRAQHFDDFDAQGFLRVAQRTLFPSRRFGALESGGHGIRQPGGVEFEQVFHLFASGHRKAAKRPVNFCHVGGEPLSVEFLLARTVKFGDLAGLTQFFHPTPDRVVRDVGKFLLVERVVEFSVQSAAVTHQPEQFLGAGGDRSLVGIVRCKLFRGEFGGKGPCSQQPLKNGRVDVLHQERTRLHRHQILKRRHEEGHAESRWHDDLVVDNASITCDAGRQEVLEANEVNITEHDLALGFTHQQTAVHRSVLLEQRFGPLLELLRTDFLRPHPFGDDE